MSASPYASASPIGSLLRCAPVLPVLVVECLEDAVPLARTLVEAGLPVLELTLRSDVALNAIERIAREVPDCVIGAGTVLDAAQLDAVQSAGARFAIAPGATDALYRAAASARIPFLPAIATASELMRGWELGHRHFKFFPAESSGGPATLRALSGPFPQARFCPTGGIDAARAPAYLALDCVLTVGGSWMVPPAALAERDWPQIRRLAAAAAALNPVAAR